MALEGKRTLAGASLFRSVGFKTKVKTGYGMAYGEWNFLVQQLRFYWPVGPGSSMAAGYAFTRHNRLFQGGKIIVELGVLNKIFLTQCL